MRRTRKRAPPPARSRWRGLLFVAFLGCCAWAGHTWGSLPDPQPLADRNPESSALIAAREEEARGAGRPARRHQTWVKLGQISPHAVDAVLASEDDRFFEHQGVDLKQTKQALVQAWETRRLGRGASTLTQQLAKNLWLSSDRSLVRKAKELVLARRLEQTLGKRRILELYLNVAEWGEGVYGIEAAARAHFGVSAAELSRAQSTVLASMLPAPRTWTPRSGSERLLARSLRLIDRLERYGRLSSAEAARARTEVRTLLGSVASKQS